MKAVTKGNFRWKSLAALMMTLMVLMTAGCAKTEDNSQTMATENQTVAETTTEIAEAAAAKEVMVATLLDGEAVGEVPATQEDGGVKVSLAAVAALIGAEAEDAFLAAGEVNDHLDIVATMVDGQLTLMTQLPTRFTEAFSVTYLKDGIKKVMDGDGRMLMLAPEGAQVPEAYAEAPVITVPLKGLLLGSTTQGGFLRAIGEEASVIGVTAAADQWHVPGIVDGLESGAITYVGDSYAPDYEMIAALEPAMTMVYTGPYGQMDMIEKLNELGIAYAVDNSYLEDDPLGRMEWMKFTAAFYNKEAEAAQKFDGAVARIEALAKSFEDMDKPTVAWGSIYKGDVYVAGRDSYVAKMIEMAGGDFVFDLEGASSSKISLEDFYATAASADVFMYASSKTWSPTLAGVIEGAPTLADMKAVEAMNVWCYHPDYYQSLDKIDELIEDLAGIFQGEKDARHFELYTE